MCFQGTASEIQNPESEVSGKGIDHDVSVISRPEVYRGGDALTIYFAPMEGVTDGILRQAHKRIFGGLMILRAASKQQLESDWCNKICYVTMRSQTLLRSGKVWTSRPCNTSWAIPTIL
jgi:hypothetical protein